MPKTTLRFNEMWSWWTTFPEQEYYANTRRWIRRQTWSFNTSNIITTSTWSPKSSVNFFLFEREQLTVPYRDNQEESNDCWHIRTRVHKRKEGNLTLYAEWCLGNHGDATVWRKQQTRVPRRGCEWCSVMAAGEKPMSSLGVVQSDKSTHVRSSIQWQQPGQHKELTWTSSTIVPPCIHNLSFKIIMPLITSFLILCVGTLYACSK